MRLGQTDHDGVLLEVRRMREKSAGFTTTKILDAFLYVLMRDYVTPGKVEMIMETVSGGTLGHELTNGWLARHAVDVADRLT